MVYNATCSMGGFILHCRVPPVVTVETMVGRGQVKPHTASLEREDEDRRPTEVFLKTLHHGIALLLGGAAVQEEYLTSQCFLEVVPEHFAHLRKLRENQRLIARGQGLRQHLFKAS